MSWVAICWLLFKNHPAIPSGQDAWFFIRKRFFCGVALWDCIKNVPCCFCSCLLIQESVPVSSKNEVSRVMKKLSTPTAGKRRLLPGMFIFLVLFSVLIQGCAIGPRVVTEYDSNSFANNPLHQRVVWTYAWGLVQPKDVNPACDASFNHLNMVEAKTNIGFLLLSAVTLGVVVPMKIKWDCAPPPVTPGDLGTDH